MIQFYAPDILATSCLPEADSQHCVKVLRSRPGDKVEVVDGRGRRYHCVITDAHPRHTMLEILASEEQAKVWPCNITIAVAPTKSIDRMEWLVEKLTEIGVDRIIPLRCRFSERKEIKRERLERVAIAAMKQSLKATLPVIDEMTPIEHVIADDAINTTYQRFVAYCSDEIPRTLFSKKIIPGTDTLVLIGPEGDFSEQEIRSALAGGYIPVTFGDNRLRTETAALVACDTVHIVNQINS